MVAELRHKDRPALDKSVAYSPPPPYRRRQTSDQDESAGAHVVDVGGGGGASLLLRTLSDVDMVSSDAGSDDGLLSSPTVVRAPRALGGERLTLPQGSTVSEAGEAAALLLRRRSSVVKQQRRSVAMVDDGASSYSLGASFDDAAAGGGRGYGSDSGNGTAATGEQQQSPRRRRIARNRSSLAALSDEEASQVGNSSMIQRVASVLRVRKRLDEAARLARLERRPLPSREEQARAAELVHLESPLLHIFPPTRQRLAFNDAIALATPGDGAKWTEHVLPSLEPPTQEEREARESLWYDLEHPPQRPRTPPKDPHASTMDTFFVTNGPPRPRPPRPTVSQLVLPGGAPSQAVSPPRRRYRNPLREDEADPSLRTFPSPLARPIVDPASALEEQDVDAVLHGRGLDRPPDAPQPTVHTILSLDSGDVDRRSVLRGRRPPTFADL